MKKVIEEILTAVNIEFEFIDGIREQDDVVLFNIWSRSTTDIGPFENINCLKKREASIPIDSITNYEDGLVS